MNTSTTSNQRGPMFAMSGTVGGHLLLLVPITLFVGNAQQFSTPLQSLLPMWLAAALGLTLVLTAIGLLVPQRLRGLYIGLLAMLGILIWLQANVLVWKYGPLDGRPVDWSQDAWRGALDSAIWLLALAAVPFVMLRARRGLLRMAGLIFLVHVLSVASSTFQSLDKLPEEVSAGSGSLEEAHRFSSGANVLHVIIDGFQGDIFQELMEHPAVGAQFQALLDGFEFYPETLAAFPYTQFSVPSFLAGRVYQNDRPKDAFLDEVLAGPSLFSAAAKQGFAVDLMLGSSYLTNRFAAVGADNLLNIDALGTPPRLVSAIKLLDLALFRSAPHYLKRGVYNQQQWLLSGNLGAGDNTGLAYFRHERFLSGFTQNASADRDRPTYKYLHVMSAHRPMVVDSDCRHHGGVLPDTRDTLLVQSKCALDSIARLLVRLKELGIYDDMLIVLQSDHGGWVPTRRLNPPARMRDGTELPWTVTSLASPLLAIKRPGASGPLRSVKSLASLLDLPDTVTDIMGWPGEFGHRSLLDVAEGEARTRRFFFYHWQEDEWNAPNTLPIQEFLIDGSHVEVEWKPGAVFPPRAGGAVPSRASLQ